jgi:hypothetical protein
MSMDSMHFHTMIVKHIVLKRLKRNNAPSYLQGQLDPLPQGFRNYCNSPAFSGGTPGWGKLIRAGPTNWWCFCEKPQVVSLNWDWNSIG